MANQKKNSLQTTEEEKRVWEMTELSSRGSREERSGLWFSFVSRKKGIRVLLNPNTACILDLDFNNRSLFYLFRFAFVADAVAGWRISPLTLLSPTETEASFLPWTVSWEAVTDFTPPTELHSLSHCVERAAVCIHRPHCLLLCSAQHCTLICIF